jgi:hypothetical protein
MDTGASPSEILVLSHSHIDIGYTFAQPVLWELQNRYIDQAIELCEATADRPEPSRLRWTCEITAPLLRWIDRASGRQLDRFRALVKAGQMSAGAMPLHVTPLYDLEQLARGLYPLRQLRSEMGLPMTVAINNDINGLPWPITDLLLDAGVELLLMGVNITMGGLAVSSPLAFDWQSPTGRRLRAFNGEIYHSFDFWARPQERNLETAAKGLAEYLARLGPDYPHDFAFLTATYPVMNDNNPPCPANADLVHRWNAEGRMPALRFVSPEQFLARLKKVPPEKVPSHAGDWTDYWNFGSGSSAYETRVNRHTRARLLGAGALRAAVGATTSERPFADRSQSTATEAWSALGLYDEHTWGVHCTVDSIRSTAVHEQWNHKANYAYTARSLTSMLTRDALDHLAGNALDGADARSVLIYNPASVARTAYCRVPNAWGDGSWLHHQGAIHQLDVLGELLDDKNSVLGGPFELPAYGYRIVPMDQARSCTSTSNVHVSAGLIESPYHRLSFDEQTGRVTSLIDKRSGTEVVDATSPWPFFGFVHEGHEPGAYPLDTPWGGREIFLTDQHCEKRTSGWPKEWKAQRLGPSRLAECKVEQSPDGATLVRRFDAPGVDALEQRITLNGHRPAIELTASFNKRDDRAPEAIYFAFPLAIPNWRAHFDTANVPLEFDAEQLPGAARDWITVGQWVAAHNDRTSVTLCCPDAPLVQIGGFNFTRMLRSVPRDGNALLLSWVMNNYWMTNFRSSQPGPVRFRWELITHDGPFDARVAAAAGAEAAAAPFELHPVLAPAPTSPPRAGRVVDVTGDGIMAIAVGPARQGEGMIVRLVNPGPTNVVAGIALPSLASVSSAEIVDPLECTVARADLKGRVAQVPVPARGSVAVRLTGNASST